MFGNFLNRDIIGGLDVGGNFTTWWRSPGIPITTSEGRYPGEVVRAGYLPTMKYRTSPAGEGVRATRL